MRVLGNNRTFLKSLHWLTAPRLTLQKCNTRMCNRIWQLGIKITFVLKDQNIFLIRHWFETVNLNLHRPLQNVSLSERCELNCLLQV